MNVCEPRGCVNVLMHVWWMHESECDVRMHECVRELYDVWCV